MGIIQMIINVSGCHHINKYNMYGPCVKGIHYVYIYQENQLYGHSYAVT